MKNSRLESREVRIAGIIAASLALASFQSATAQVLYGTAGSTYSQNFDSLPNTPQNTSLGSSPTGWIDDTASPSAGNFSIVGWYLWYPTSTTEGGANGHQRMRIGAGTATTGAFMSFGASGSTDRALGDIGSNVLTPTPPAAGTDIYIGLRLQNTTGQTLNSITLTYDGEQWRDGGDASPNAQTMTFGYSTTATAISDPNSSFTAVSALDFTSPVFANTGSGAAVDGNGVGKVAGITATITGLDWADGTDLWLRWDDVNNAGNDHGLAIDNLTFTAIEVAPEPATWSLFGLGALALGLFRRKRK